MVCSSCGAANSNRIQYHITRFQSKEPDKVLGRYWGSLANDPNDAELQRYATHIAAWVAAPLADRVKSLAVELLAQYLAKLKVREQNCCPCLLSGLKMMWQSAPLILHGPWAQLRDVLPEVAETSETGCGQRLRRLKILQKRIQSWRNKVGSERTSFVESLEAELQQLKLDQDFSVHSVLCRAVAALAPPRFAAEALEASEVKLEAVEVERDLQRRLRRVVIFCLSHVDLQDEKLSAVLGYLKALLQELDKKQDPTDPRTPRRPLAARQWYRLHSKVHGTDELPLDCVEGCQEAEKKIPRPKQLVSLQDVGKHLDATFPVDLTAKQRVPSPQRDGERSFRSVCEHGKARNLCRFCKGCPHGRLRQNCKFCVPCPHGRLKRGCRECNACLHGKAHRSCNLCNGCPHGRMKADCRKCRSCPHGKLRRGCILCVPCPHGKLKHKCKSCSACPHGNRKDLCRECMGCEHGKVRYRCSICNACPHGKLKKHCAVCNGCIHGRRKDKCRTVLSPATCKRWRSQAR
eukprot:s1090_g5.t1